MSTFFDDREEKRLRITFDFSQSMKASITGDTIDDLIIGLGKLNNAKFILEFASQVDLTEEQFAQLDNMIVKTQNIQMIERYLNLRRYNVNNVDSFEQSLISIGNVGLIVRFSQQHQGKHFRQMEDTVIASGLDWAIYAFSQIKGADLKKIKRALCELKAIEVFINFCKEHKDSSELVEENDKKTIEEWVIQSKDASFINKLAEASIDGVNMDKLLDAIIETGATSYIVKFAKLKSDPEKISKLQEAVIAGNNPDDIFYFARDVKGADIKTLYMATKRLGDKSYIKRFKNNIKCDFFWF